MSAPTWSISVQDADTGDVLFEQTPARVLKTASIGKILLLIHVAELIRGNYLELREALTRTGSDAVADSGVWQYLAVDALSVGDLCELVGMASDNLATNVLLSRVGLEGVAGSARRLGLRHTALHDRVRDERTSGDPPTLSTGNATELAQLMAHLHQGAVAGDDLATRVLGWLSKGMDLSQVAAAWLLDPLAHHEAAEDLQVVNKTGTDLGVRAETGVLSGPAAAVAYAVIANWDDGAGDHRDAVLAHQRDVGVFVAQVARGEQPADPFVTLDQPLEW